MHVPTLRDGDLVLRPKRPADAEAITAACQDPEIPRWTFVPSPYSLEDARAFLESSARRRRPGNRSTCSRSARTTTACSARSA